MKQLIFDRRTIKLYFWSPYADIDIVNDAARMCSSLTGVNVLITMSNIKLVFEKLTEGTTYSELVDCISSETDETEARAWIRTLVDLKIIE